jgi:hypothetical protein
VHAVILRYLDQVARVRSIRRAAEDLPAERGLGVSYETVRRSARSGDVTIGLRRIAANCSSQEV